jgi:hypothetical protein
MGFALTFGLFFIAAPITRSEVLEAKKQGLLLSEPTTIPGEKGKYVNASLPQYQDIDAALKIGDEALARAGM